MEATFLPSTECFALQTKYESPQNEITKIRQIIDKETYYAVLMNDCFNELKPEKWGSLQAAIEVVVQVNHLLKSLLQVGNTYLIGDELTDILSNIFLLAHFEGISFSDIATYAKTTSSKIIDLLFLSSEVLEEIRKNNGYKIQDHEVEDSKITIKEKLSEMIIIVFNYAKEFNKDLANEFETMHKNSTKFLYNKMILKSGEQDGNIRYF